MPADRLTRFFAPGGTLERAMDAWEPREGQVAMAREVAATLQGGGHLVVEAGTGTGKTLAYLVPAVLSGERVVVSTGTLTLQDQIARKDVPFLKERCRLDFDAVTLKGRDNYLCRHRFDLFDRSPLLPSAAETETWPAVRAWAAETATGDLAELTILPERPSFWQEVNAKDSTCLGAKCPSHDECHLHEVRRRAREADVVIVNHHLYLADAAVRASQFGQVLPDHDRAIFDEAHALPDAATSFFGRTVSSGRLRELCDDVLRELARAGITATGVAARAAELASASARLADAFAGETGRSVLPARLPTPQDDALALCRAAVRGLAAALAALTPPPAEVEPFTRRAEELSADLDVIHARADDSNVYWCDVRGRSVFLTATPIDLAPILRERVFARLHASVSCSATLAVGGTLRHARQRLGLIEEGAGEADAAAVELTSSSVTESVHPSPFDFESQGLLYLPEDVPDPRQPGFAPACAREAAALLAASGGRAFLLFTSFDNLHRVHEILRHEIDHPVLVQGDAPRHELLRRFQATVGSVLFATASFWEGVDVPGKALSLVVIDKLPFGVPSDPVLAARSRLVEERGGSAFLELSLPEAVLALKQGVGRLIRTRTDRGVVALLDPRVTTTSYGRAFLQNLPPLRQTQRLADVAAFFRAGGE